MTIFMHSDYVRNYVQLTCHKHISIIYQYEAKNLNFLID